MKGLPRSLARAPLNQPKEYVQRIRYPINHTVNVAAAGAGTGFGTVVLGDIPEGNVLILGRALLLALSTVSANITNVTYTPTFSVGSTPDADGTLSGTDADMLVSTAGTIAAGKVSPSTTYFTSVVNNPIDNRNGNGEVNLNVTIPPGDISDATSAAFTATGFFELVYVTLGDA